MQKRKQYIIDDMKKFGIFALFAGLIVSTVLIAYHSFAAVGGAVWRIGWGVSAVVAIHLVAIILCGVAWRLLFLSEWPVRTKLLIVLRWIRESINTMLPVARVGGDIAAARLLVLRGIRVNVAGSSIIADRTVEVFSQFFFAVAGVLALIAQGANHDLAHWSVIGLLVIFPILIAFIIVQRVGLLRVLEKAVLKFTGKWREAHGSGNTDIHNTIWTIYGNGRRLVMSTFFHTLGWLLGVVQILLALNFMGHKIGWVDAFIVESLSQVVCTAAFIIPASLGAQEAGYMVVGELFGIPPELGLALSLVKRLSDVLAGIPGLLVWQGLEGRRLWELWTGRRREANSRGGT